METLVLTLDTIAFMMVIYFSYKSEKAPDKPEQGPFRIKVDTPAALPPVKRVTNTRIARDR